MTEMPHAPPRQFDAAFRASLRDLVLWRRDVRRFRRDPVDPHLINDLLELASHAPSVGHCQPWRFVLVESPARRAAVRSSFVRANARALDSYDGERPTQVAPCPARSTDFQQRLADKIAARRRKQFAPDQ